MLAFENEMIKLFLGSIVLILISCLIFPKRSNSSSSSQSCNCELEISRLSSSISDLERENGELRLDIDILKETIMRLRRDMKSSGKK